MWGSGFLKLINNTSCQINAVIFSAPTPGPSWGYFKSQFPAGLSTVGDNFPQKRGNGSKNGAGIPPRRSQFESAQPQAGHVLATPECKTWWTVFQAPMEAHLTFGNCCPVDRIDFWQPLPILWRGKRMHHTGHSKDQVDGFLWELTLAKRPLQHFFSSTKV